MSSKYEIIGEFKTSDIEKGQKKVSSGLNDLDQKSNKLNAGFKKLGGALAGAFAVSAIVDFGKRVAETRGEFQKLQAVLENTLGSKSGAQQAFKVLNQLAQKSNFGLLELTDSYVKLRNQGIEPTRKEMVALQDLANSTGKGFNQLAEALIDAQVGEMERLKEFGVRAQKEGDKVKFTFKGVTTEVDNTSEAISKYVIGLGQIKGVTGSTEKISGTLAGRISNLGDAFDNMLNKVGINLQPQLEKTLSFLTSILAFVPPIVDEIVDAGKSLIETLDKAFVKTGIVNGIWQVLKFTINTVVASISTLWDSLKFGMVAFTALMAGQWQTAIFSIKQGIVEIDDTWRNQFDQMGALFSRIMGKMKDDTKGFAKEFQSTMKSNTVVVEKVERDIRSESDATALTRAKNGKEFSEMAVGLALNRSIALMIEKIIASVPFPFNIALAGGAGAIVKSLFSGIAKFESGGVVGGTSFSGDKELIRVNSGERVLNIPQQQFMMSTAGMNNDKLDTMINQLEQLIDLNFFREQAPSTMVQSSIGLVNTYDEGIKNRELLRGV